MIYDGKKPHLNVCFDHVGLRWITNSICRGRIRRRIADEHVILYRGQCVVTHSEENIERYVRWIPRSSMGQTTVQAKECR